MLNSYNHIISTFSWNTFLDQKDKAGELQARLSAWSGINMQKEINEVFNKLCPPDQTWRIDQLELDLGAIEMHSLESDLARSLRMQLTEKLMELIIYADKAGQDNIEITNQYDAPIDTLRSYLLNGVMPWNYRASDGSFNQLLSWQFQHNRQVVLAMLREVGVAHEDVRKRMAWQMNEPNIQKTIEGFEPGNHEQITRFSNELIKVQTKENVVRTGTADFKKNVWLWILNYLLTERGTLFNKLAFLKSSIVQMAAHYNIGYEELLQLLNDAVDEVNKNTTVKADFLLALKTLSKENAIAEIRTRFSQVPGIKIDDKTAKLLVNAAKTESFITVQIMLNEVLSNGELIELAKIAKPRISALLLEAILKHRVKSGGAILEYVLEKLLLFTPAEYIGQFSLFIEKIAVDKAIPGSVAAVTKVGRLKLAYHAAYAKKCALRQDAKFINHLLPGGVRLMQQLVKQYGELLQPMLKNWSKPNISSRLKEIFWTTLLDYASHKGDAASFRKTFVSAIVFYLPVRKTQLQAFSIKVEKDVLRLEELVAKPSEKLLIVHRKGLIDELIRQIIANHHLPVWFTSGDKEQDAFTVMQEIVIHYPQKLFTALKKELISESQGIWLHNTINLPLFVRSIGFIEKNSQPTLAAFEKFYVAIENIVVPGITHTELQQILFRKLITALITNNWKIISAYEMLKDLLREAFTVKNVSRSTFVRELVKQKHLLPAVFQLSLEKIQDDISVKLALSFSRDDVSNKIRQLMKTKNKQAKTGTPVRNAGIVLLNSYTPMLFERLNLIKDKKFESPDAQEQAVLYLQYVVTGLCHAEETELALNKVLCGLSLSKPVQESLEISQEHKDLVDGLIKAAISYWPTIGDCSVDGFRGNWLVRNGLLVEHEDKWELVVEKRAYDILINHSPFSFSIIKYLWMNKPLHVSWAY